MADDLTWTCTITRVAPLTATPLDLHDITNYELFAFSLGGVTPDHTEADEAWVDGNGRSHSKLKDAIRQVGVRVKGATLAAWGTNAKNVVDAFKQQTYTVAATVNNPLATGTLSLEFRDCGMAEMIAVPKFDVVGDSIDRFGWMRLPIEQDLLFTFPSNPADFVGPW